MVPCSLSPAKQCPPPDQAIELVPADTLLYAHLVRDPESEQLRLSRDIGTRIPDFSAVSEAVLSGLGEDSAGGIQFGRDILPWAELFVALPDRSRAAIRCRLRTLDLRPTSGRRWSEEESRLLTARWSLVGRRTLLATFPGRSWQAIFERAMALGLPSVPQGYETLMAACRRCGIERQTAMGVLAWTRRQSEIVRAIQLWAHAIGARLGLVDCSGRWDQNTWDTAEVEMV